MPALLGDPPPTRKRVFLCLYLFAIALAMSMNFTFLLRLRSPAIASPSFRDDDAFANDTDGNAAIDGNSNRDDGRLQWMNATGVALFEFHGDRTTCRDVIYMADTRLPTDVSFVHPSWRALSHIAQNFPAFNFTCVAFYRTSDDVYDANAGPHPVWSRLPATALAMSHFPRAGILLYLDTDAVLADGNHAPTAMYELLAEAHRPDDAAPAPGLIVNKPRKGWLCKVQCENFGLGEGCFNTGALLWRRSADADVVLRAWWESRRDDPARNFRHETRGWFDGWSAASAGDLQHDNARKMSEQNRLMWTYAADPEVRRRVLPVPRRPGAETNATSCPERVDAAHTPCLQDDAALHDVLWDRRGRYSCFVNHYADKKAMVYRVAKKVLESNVGQNSSQPLG